MFLILLFLLLVLLPWSACGSPREVCDGVDNDGNGWVDAEDPGVADSILVWMDADGDGWGSAAYTRRACASGDGWVDNSSDCDDASASNNPAAVEVCDGVDNDCDGRVDNADASATSSSVWYADADGDGAGDPRVSQVACVPGEGYLADGTDCDDANPDIHPGATERCRDEVDQDCDGAPDPSDRICKRLLHYGWDAPYPADLAAMGSAAEDAGAPFDGVAFMWSAYRVGLSRSPLDAVLLQTEAQQVAGVEFSRFKENFFYIGLGYSSVDWFGDFTVPLENARLMGETALAAGVAGLTFDPEHYSAIPFRYDAQPDANRYTRQEYEDQVRQRGREWMAALEEGYPGITVWTLWGYSIAALYGVPGAAWSYDLLPAFLDGMTEEAESTTRFLDGFEFSYCYTAESDWDWASILLETGMDGYSGLDDTQRARWQASFALWIDCNATWDAEHIEANYFSPESLESTLVQALTWSDGYVWLYSQNLDFFTGSKVPDAYLVAMENALEATR